METNLILSKESSESEIKRYFNAVLELSKSNNEFPINLDEVWMLVYGRKSDAAEALQRDFIENVDYKDIAMLRRFISERGKILPRRVTGICAKHQRKINLAIKRARAIALLPFSAD